jgi:hypothetical protein
MTEDSSPIKIKGCAIRVVKWALSRAQDIDFTFKENNNRATKEQTNVEEGERNVADV